MKRLGALLMCTLLSACGTPPLSSFVLRDPVTDQPLAHTPYHIVFTQRRIVHTGPDVTRISDKVAQGTTDSTGHTGEIDLDAPDNGDHALVARHGKGQYGRVFVARWPYNGEPVRTGYEIRTIGCPVDDVYRGFTNKQGMTVYFASEYPCKLDFSTGDRYKPANQATPIARAE